MTTTHTDVLATLAELSPDAITARRAEAINAAREAGLTWRAIARALDMTETGVQRAPGVKSPWNDRH